MDTEKQNQDKKNEKQPQPQNPIKKPEQDDTKERKGTSQMGGDDVSKRREGQSGPGAPGVPMTDTENTNKNRDNKQSDNKKNPQH